jgi:uncharacterized protein with HEPN domain
MLDACQSVISYSTKHTYENFTESDWEVIGEAARNIPKKFRDTHPGIPWRDIIDFRNVAIHQYMEVDATIVWNVLQYDIPPLLTQLEEILLKSK